MQFHLIFENMLGSDFVTFMNSKFYSRNKLVFLFFLKNKLYALFMFLVLFAVKLTKYFVD